MLTLHSVTRYAIQIITLVSLATSAAIAAERIAGVDLVMDPPPGFSPATAFIGFQQVQSFSTIEVRELEAPFESMVTQLSPEIFAKQNIIVKSTLPLRVRHRDARLLELETNGEGSDFNKWMLIIGDAYRSLSITAAYPRLAAATMREPLKKSLLSAQWLRTPTEQLFYDLPFTLEESEDLKFAKRAPSMLVLANTSQTGALGSESPSIVVGHLSSETELGDIKTISHTQLEQLSTIQILEILEEGETRVDGIRSYQIQARAKPVAGDYTLIFKQILAFQQYKYLLVHSSVPELLAQQYQPQFEQVVESIKFKPAL